MLAVETKTLPPFLNLVSALLSKEQEGIAEYFAAIVA